MIPGVLTPHICNSCTALNFGKPVFQRNQNRQLHIQTEIKPVAIYFLETELAGLTKNIYLTTFGPDRISLKLSTYYIDVYTHNLRPEMLTKTTQY